MDPSNEQAELGIDMSGWTTECAHPDELLALARGGVEAKVKAPVVAHIKACDYCTRRFAETRELVRNRAHATQPDTAAPVPALGWRRVLPPAAWAAAGAAVAIIVVTATTVASLRSEQARTSTQLAAARQEARNQAAEADRSAAALRDALAGGRGAPRVTASADTAFVEAAVVTGQMPVPDAVRGLAGVVRGGSPSATNAVALDSPIGTLVMEARPVLKASPAPGVSGLKCTVTDQAGLAVPVAPLTPRSWRAAADLPPGEVCQWSVKGRRAGREVVSEVGTFGRITARGAADVAAARKGYREAPLHLAVAYARAGLLDEAEGTLRGILAEHRGSAVAAALLADLKRTRSALRASPTPGSD